MPGAMGNDRLHEVELTPCRIQPRFEPRVELTLEGVDPQGVSDQLGIDSDLALSPEMARRMEEAGELRSWAITTHGRVLTKKLAEHLDWISARLSGKESQFKAIARTASSAEIRVHGPDSKWQLDQEAMKAARVRFGVDLTFMMILFGQVQVVAADDLTYREAEAKDAPAISRLLAEMGYPASPDEIPARLNALSKHPNTLALVAADGDDVVGLITSHVFPSIHVGELVAWITSLVVSSEHRGVGIGSELVERAEFWAAAHGATRVSLTSALHREGAHTFYEKKQRYQRTGLRFSKALPPAGPAEDPA